MRSDPTVVVPITLRSGDPGDIPVCARMLDAWVDETLWMPRLHDLAGIERYMEETLFEQNDVTVAEYRGEVQAYLAVREDGFIPGFTVMRHARGQGIGSALIGWAQSWKRRLSLWCFAENLGARRFYARHRFMETRRTQGENDEGLPDILFVWEAGR